MKSNITTIFIAILLISFEFTHGKWEDVISNSLTDYETFEKYWEYLYPWGSDHNGSARMYGSSTDHNHVYLEGNQVILKACKIDWDEGTSTANPHPEIH